MLLGSANNAVRLSICCGKATASLEQEFRERGFTKIQSGSATFDGFLAREAGVGRCWTKLDQLSLDLNLPNWFIILTVHVTLTLISKRVLWTVTLLICCVFPGFAASSFKVGKTTRDEVERKLGAPYAEMRYAGGVVRVRWPDMAFHGSDRQGNSVHRILTFYDCDFGPSVHGEVLWGVRRVDKSVPLSSPVGLMEHTFTPNCGRTPRPDSAVSILAISPDGRLLASTGNDDTIKLWHLPDGTLLDTLKGGPPRTNFFSLVFSPGGEFLVSGSNDGKGYSIELWSLPGGALLKTFTGHSSRAVSLAISPDGKALAAGTADYPDGKATIELWSLPDGTLLKTLNLHTTFVNSLAISSDGKLLVSGSFIDMIELWSLPDGALLKTLKGPPADIVRSVAISPDSTLLVSAGDGGIIALWGLPDGAALKTFKGHSGAVHSVAISRDGKLLASAGANVFGHGTIALWRLPDGALVKTLDDDPGPKDIARSVEISADGKLLVSAGYDETIKLWDLPNRAFRTCFIDTQFAQ